MKNHRYDRYIFMGVTAVLVIIAAISVVFLFLERKSVFQMGNKVLSVLAPIIYGAILTFLLSPIYNAARNGAAGLLSGRRRKETFVNSASKIVGTAASLIFLTAVIASLSKMIIPQIYMSIQGIVNTMPAYIQNIYNWLTELFASNPPLEETVLTAYQMSVEAFQSWAGENLIPNLQSLENLQNLEKIVGGVSNGVLNLFNLAKNLLLGLIVMIYLLNIKDLLTAQGKKIVYAFVPLKTANGIIDEFRYIHRVFSGFIIGKLIDSLIIGIICFILMKLFKMPFELLISVIIGVTNVIPFFGPFIGAIPSAILVFLISPKQCLYFIGLILVLQQFDGNILGPKILGNSTGVSSFWVLSSILFFGGMWGFVGMIVAVPVTAVIFDLFSKLQNGFLQKKNLSADTNDYMGLKKIDEDDGTYMN